MPCGRLPFVLETCPCCGAGVKFCRGWTWIVPAKLFKKHRAQCKSAFQLCGACPVNPANYPDRAGLLWIGGVFYGKPQDWLDEAAKMGVSRRIKSVPKGFEVGKTWVYAAHIRAVAVPHRNGEFKPGVFHVFRPTAIEYVTTGKETPEQIAALEKRGISPVKVERDGYLGGGVLDDESKKELAVSPKAGLNLGTVGAARARRARRRCPEERDNK